MIKLKRTNHNQFVRCVENIQDLSGMGFYEYAMLLNAGAYSKKTIKYFPQTKKYIVTNHIDDTKQTLTEKQLMNEKVTLIGKAMKLRSLIALID